MSSRVVRLFLVGVVLACCVAAAMSLSGDAELGDGVPVFVDEETWPEDPEVGVWYRLNYSSILVSLCGPTRIGTPGAPLGTIYHNRGAQGVFRSTSYRRGPDVSRDGLGGDYLGFARLHVDQSLDYSPDGVNEIVTYQLVLEESLDLCH